MRLLKILIFSIALFATVVHTIEASNHNVAGADSTARTWITIYRYRGVDPASSSAAQFGMFRGLIEKKFENLRDHFDKELGRSAGYDFMDYINRISIKQNHNDELPNNNLLVRDWLQTEIEMLQVLRGTIFLTPQGSAKLFTRSHFIEIPGEDEMRNFSINLKLTEDEFANTKDSHSLVILYAIANEAKRLGVERSQIAVIVSYALNAIADLERRNGSLQGDMLEIKEAWQEFKNAL